MAGTVIGRVDWGRRTYDDSHRDYNIRFLVKMDSPLDGPQACYLASGAPAIGSSWAYGNDSDAYALCIPNSTCTPLITREPNIWWYLDQTFTTRPIKRCQTSAATNPLSEPQKISGTFVKYVREAFQRADGTAITSSSHEQFRGIERDDSRPTVTIEQNVASLDLSTVTAMRDTLNDATLWGLPARTIKLSNISWTRGVYGTCTYYYTRRFEFDIRFEGFDIYDLVDTGFKVFDDETYDDTVNNRADPRKYRLAVDTRGGNPQQKVFLNGNGSEIADLSEITFLDPVELYSESNFLTLGIPSSL